MKFFALACVFTGVTASENKTTSAKDADYVMPFDGLKLDSLEKFNFGKLGKLDFDFIPGDFTKFGSGTKEKEFSDKDCKGGGSSTATVQPGLGTEEFNNYVLDIEKIDALLAASGAEFDPTALYLNRDYDSFGSVAATYRVNSIRYGGSGCPPQDTTDSAIGLFDDPTFFQFDVPQVSLTCPTDSVERASLPTGVLSQCFARYEIEVDFSSTCDGSTQTVILPGGQYGGGLVVTPSDILPSGVASGMTYERAAQTALVVDGQAVFEYGRERSRMARFGVQEGGGDFPTFTAPITLDAASGCIDGKVNLTLLTGWRVGLQATAKCVPGATLSTVVPDLNNFESTQFITTFDD